MQISLVNSGLFDSVVKLIRNSDKIFSWSDNQILDSLHKDLILGLFDNDNLLAIAIFSKVCDTAELLYICVDRYNHNRGLGFKLLKESIDYLAKQHIKEIFLEVNVQNYNAIKLYKKLNFKQISLRKNYYTKNNDSSSDAFVYKLEL
ncbi:MAG: GNAT family N-acetyltransferase [Francisella sp.]